MWVAARDPNTFEFAAKNGCNIMSTALRKPFEEVHDLQSKFIQAARHSKSPIEHATLRTGCVYEDEAGRDDAIRAMINFGRSFENLFKNIGEVQNGYPEAVDFEIVANRGEYQPDALTENMLLGTPEEIIAKIKQYQDAGIDHVILGTSFFLPHKRARRSLELFCEHVIPYFQKTKSSAEKLGMVAQGG